MESINNEINHTRAFLGLAAGGSIVAYMSISIVCLWAMDHFGSRASDLHLKYMDTIKSGNIRGIEKIDQKQADANCKYVTAIATMVLSSLVFCVGISHIISAVPSE